LGFKIEHFAYPFGNAESFSERAMKIAKQRFQFVYSGLRGDNVAGASSFTIRRDAAALQHPATNSYSVYSNSLLGSFLEGSADRFYASSRKKIDLWNNNTNQGS
jgi:hypothetical protein